MTHTVLVGASDKRACISSNAKRTDLAAGGDKMKRYYVYTLLMFGVISQSSPVLAADLFGRTLDLPSFQLPLDAEVNALRHTPPSPPVAGAYGHGFDSMTGKVLPQVCVKVTSLIPKAGGVPSGGGEHVFHEDTSIEQLRNDSKTTAGASLLYDAFSVSASGSVVNGSFFNSFGRYIAAYQEVITNEFIAKGEGNNGDLTLTALALANLKIGLSTFKSACGDHFISGYREGGIFNVVASVKAATDDKWSANEASVNLGFKDIFGANFSNSSNYSKISSSSSFDVRDISSGVVSPAVSMENLYQSYADYGKLVVAKPGLVSFVFTPYNALGGADAAKIPDFSALEEAEIEILAAKRDQARSNSNDLQVAVDAISKGYSKIFLIDTKPEDARTEIDKYIEDIAIAADGCRNATTPGGCTTAIEKVGTVPANHVKRAPPGP